MVHGGAKSFPIFASCMALQKGGIMKRTSLTVTALAALAGGLALISCARTGDVSGTGAMQSGGQYAAVNSYPATGVVESISPDRTHATIHHQAIPGFMPEDTMDIAVKNTNDLNGISPGDKITFQLVQGAREQWIDDVSRTGQ
jgi:Cu/Ag efflux protein CusF